MLSFLHKFLLGSDEYYQFDYIKAAGLVKKYGSFYALYGIDFIIENNGVFGIIGESGSGKSTLMKIFAGLTKPDKGNCYIDKQSADEYKTSGIISYLPDKFDYLDDMTVKDILKFNKYMYKDFSFGDAVNMIYDMAINSNACFGCLSNEEKRLVQFACVVSRASKVYLLDEPFMYISDKNKEYIKQIIERKKKNAAVIIAMRYEKDIEHFFDRIMLLEHGEISMDISKDELLKNNPFISDGLLKGEYK